MTDSSEVLSIGQEADAVRYGASSGIQRGGARARAKPSLAAAPAASVEAVTESAGVADIQARAQGFADSLAAKWQVKFGEMPPLIHARPPSIAQDRERLHAAAGHYDAALLKAARLTYGYLRLLVKIALNAVEWATFSPVGLVISVATVLIFWFYL